MSKSYEIAKDIVEVFRKSSITPHDTGNLRYNGIKGVQVSKNTSLVVFGGEVAHYAVYLQFSNFAGRSVVKPNRHKGFTEKIIGRECIPYLERKYGGKRV